MKLTRNIAIATVLALMTTACVSFGGEDDPDAAFAMPTDTYENCGSVGSDLLSSAGLSSSSGDAVRLGMTECQLLNALGAADELSPQFAPEGERRIIISYVNESGGSTAYLFVDNALKEINRVR